MSRLLKICCVLSLQMSTHLPIPSVGIHCNIADLPDGSYDACLVNRVALIAPVQKALLLVG